MNAIFARPILRRLRRDEDGVTLAELTVTMVVLGLLASVTVLMVTASMRVSSGTKERMDQSNSATIAMQRVSRTLRTAVLQSQLTTTCTLAICTESAFLQGTRTSVQFYADVDNPKNTVGPSRVTYSVVGGVLTETVQKPDSPTPDAAGYHYCNPGPGCTIRTTVLATDVQTTGPVFSFYTAADPVNAINLAVGAQLTAAQLKAVDSIDISLLVRKAGGANVAGASMVQRVALPNADSVVRTDGT
jgi:prepilin-type N-terminal cleavage/methylation domain-containing protein